MTIEELEQEINELKKKYDNLIIDAANRIIHLENAVAVIVAETMPNYTLTRSPLINLSVPQHTDPLHARVEQQEKPAE